MKKENINKIDNKNPSNEMRLQDRSNITKSNLNYAGIPLYSDLLSSLGHTINSLEHCKENNMICYNPSDVETMRKFYGVVYYISKHETIDNNQPIADEIETFKNTLELNRSKNIKSITLIVGRMGTGKTTIMEGMLERTCYNSDTLYISDTKAFAEQVLNLNNSLADIQLFTTFKPDIKKLKHRNIFIDSLYCDNIEFMKSYLECLTDFTDNLVITLNIPSKKNYTFYVDPRIIYIRSFLDNSFGDYELNIIEMDEVQRELEKFEDYKDCLHETKQRGLLLSKRVKKALQTELVEKFKCDFKISQDGDGIIVTHNSKNYNNYCDFCSIMKDVCAKHLTKEQLKILAIAYDYADVTEESRKGSNNDNV